MRFFENLPTFPETFRRFVMFYKYQYTYSLRNMKTIKLVIEDTKKGRVVIPVTEREARDMYDLAYMIGDFKDVRDMLQLNKCENSFETMHIKFAKVIDALDDGKAHTLKNGKLVPSTSKFYHSGRKPLWKKG